MVDNEIHPQDVVLIIVIIITGIIALFIIVYSCFKICCSKKQETSKRRGGSPIESRGQAFGSGSPGIHSSGASARRDAQ
jgi:hypothetical protein